MFNRGIGKATMWIPGTHHSHVRIIETESGETAKIQFQNNKFEVVEFDLTADDLIQLFEMESFLNR